MPQFTTPEGHTFITEHSLLDMVAKFVRNPRPDNWSRLELAMLAHQQAHYMGEVDLIQDACVLSDREVTDLFDEALV